MSEGNDLLAMHPTDKGLALLSKVMAREIPLKFTRVAVGEGFLPEGTPPWTMTGLSGYVRDLPICGKSDGGGIALISCLQSSKGLKKPYEAREYGLFAEDPDDGEILYAYHNAGDKPDYIPSEGSPIVVDWILSLATVVKRASSIEVTLDHSVAFVTYPELEQRLKDIFPPATGGVDPAEIAAIWARLNSDQGNVLRPIDITLIKQIVLGSDMHDVNHMLRSITGQLTWNDLHNRYSRDKVHIELFYKDGVTMSRHLKIPVEEVVVGSDCIDVTDTQELELGLEYLLSDANGQEFVKVKEILSKERFRTEEPVKRAYGTTGTTICLSNWIYDDDRNGGAVAQTGQVYQSKMLDMICNAKGEHSIIIRRDLGEGTLTVERWTGEAWVACEVSENVLSSGGYGTPSEDQRMLAIYKLPYVLKVPTKLRVTCTKGPVRVDWIVVKSLFCAAEAPKPRITKTKSWDTPGTYQWTAPAGTTFVRLTAIAGGNGGGGWFAGNAGEGVVEKVITVGAGQTYTITIGMGGIGEDRNDPNFSGENTSGGDTSFDNLLTLRGGHVKAQDGPYCGGGGQMIDNITYTYSGAGAAGIIPGSRGGLPVVRREGDPVHSQSVATAGVRGGGGGSGMGRYGGSIGWQFVPGGNGGNGYLELSWEEDGSWD